MTKPLKLDGAALTIAQAIAAIQKRTVEQRDALEERYQADMKALGEEHHTSMMAEWTSLFQLLDLPAAEIGRWGLDARYLEAFGLAFLEKQGTCSCDANHEDGEAEHVALGGPSGRKH